jgi:MFS family permease
MPVLVMVMMTQAGMLMVSPAMAGIVESIPGGSGSATATGVVFAAIGVGGAISSFGAGWLAGAIGLRPVFMGAAGAVTVLSLGPFIANSYGLFAFLMFVVSLFQGGLTGLLFGMVALKAPTGGQGMAFGASQVANSAGVALGPMIGGAAVVAFGFKSVFLVNVVLFVSVFVLAAVVVRAGEGARR